MILQGALNGQSLTVAVVTARFNDFITERLHSGARDCLLRHGVSAEAIYSVWVPGAFELPLTALKLAQTGKYHTVICLGSVIRGDTTHYDYVCNEAAKGIATSKFKDVKGYADKIRTPILLQDHATVAWFRNLKIRELPAR